VCSGELTLEQAAALVPVARTFTPDPFDREIYERHFAEYRKVYGSLKGFYRRMNG
jgi:xylulokinase